MAFAISCLTGELRQIGREDHEVLVCSSPPRPRATRLRPFATLVGSGRLARRAPVVAPEEEGARCLRIGKVGQATEGRARRRRTVAAPVTKQLCGDPI